MISAARFCAVVLLGASACGCYAAHERDGAADVGTSASDGAARIDAAAVDASPACERAVVPACASGETVIALRELACNWGSPGCVVMNLAGTADDSSPNCLAGERPAGTALRIVRCIPTPMGAAVRVTAVSSPSGSGSFLIEDATSCECMGSTGFGMGDPQEMFLTGSTPAGDAITLVGTSTTYRVEVCAWGPCS